MPLSATAQTDPVSAVLAQPNWDETLARSAAQTHGQNDPVDHWLRMAKSGQAHALLSSLKSSADRGSPAFESQLFRLAVGLSEVPFDPEIDDLLDWLAHYPVEVLVPHPEHPDHAIPLFPVPAAALGSQFQRQRLAATRTSAELLQSDWSEWTDRYLAANTIERQGFNTALGDAPLEVKVALARDIQGLLLSHAALAVPASALALDLADSSLLMHSFRAAPGADSAPMLRKAAERFNAAQRAELLYQAIDHAPAEKAALGISILAPGLRADPIVSQSLLDLLAHPDLGSAAALALAGHPDKEVQSRLQDLRQSDGLVARRAALALDSLPAGEAE